MHALIINPDLDSRIRLKQALNFVPEFKIVKMVSTLTEALQRLRAGESFGSVFVSTLFGHEVAREFIGQSKESAGGRESAYILTLSGGAKSIEVAADLSHGADGFLVEPFSVDALQKIYRLAVRVKKQFILARQKESLRLLMQEAADCIDHHAFSLSLVSLMLLLQQVSGKLNKALSI